MGDRLYFKDHMSNLQQTANAKKHNDYDSYLLNRHLLFASTVLCIRMYWRI